MINFFDELAFLKGNPDIAEAINNGEVKDLKLHFEEIGLADIRKGFRKFHYRFEPFDESLYLEMFPDIKKAVEEGIFPKAFQHFYANGYKEIIDGSRSWPEVYSENSEGDESINKVVEPRPEKVIVVLGVPRSGLTMMTALLGGNCDDVTTWFLPYATRAESSREAFSDFSSLRKVYAETFPNEEPLKNTVVISESTADHQNIELIVQSLQNFDRNGVDTHIVWMTRDIHHTYISQMETAFKYWGGTEPIYNKDTYNAYVEFVKNSYLNLMEVSDNFNTSFVGYESFLRNPEKNLNKIYSWLDLECEPFNGEPKLVSHNVVGDPSFCGDTILKEKPSEREEIWLHLGELDTLIDPLLQVFIEGMKERKGILLSGSVPYSLQKYKSALLHKHFDEAYYVNRYDDIKNDGIDPCEHYLEHGWKEGRDPNEYFQTQWYKDNVFDDDLTPSFLHYLLIGRYITVLEEPVGIMENLKIIDPESYEITEDLILEAPKFKNPKVSIIVPAYNEENYTMACIESIIANTEVEVSYEIIVMDDKSPDESARLIERNLKNVKFITNGVNYGFLMNCNKGSTFAKGDYLLFLNNDTNVQPGWLSSLVELIESSDNIGMVGSRLVYPTGQQQEAGGIIWKDASGWNFGHLDDPNKPEYNYVKDADYLTGAAMMIRASLWEEIGGFDERYVPAYFEDSDLAFEVRKHGYRTVYQPKSTVIHFEGISHGTDTGMGIKRYQVLNREKFIEKWKDVLEREHFDNAQEVYLARDRSRYKKHILIIDHYVPHFDKDAGSRTMWQYLEVFIEMGYHVTFVGDNYYKHEPYTSDLEQLGVEVLYGSYYNNHFDEWLAQHGKYFDFVYLLRPHIAIKYIDKVKQHTNAKIFYNGTDFHFLRMEREYKINGDEKLLLGIEDMKSVEFKLFEQSDCVLTISDYERKYFQKEFPNWNVEVIPTFIYNQKFPLSKNNSYLSRSDLLFVGGFVHAPNLVGIKWFLNDIWPSLIKQYPEIKLYIVGSNTPDEIKNLENENIIVKGFISDQELEILYNNVKVVIAPLTFGAGVKGKIIESIAHGVPVVTTPIGSEGIINATDCMKVANNEKDFIDKVVSIYMDENEWNYMREKQIMYSNDNMSYDSVKSIIKKLF